MRVLVTGGGGFLGAKIVAMLCARGDTAVSLARSDYPHLRALGAHTVRGDITDPESVARALDGGVEAIIHTAARVGMWGPHEDFVKINVEGTRTLLEASRVAGVSRFVFTSSPSVTFDGGDAINAPQNTPYPTEFLASYPQTKALAEQLAIEANSSTLHTTSLRPHLIWGPGDPHLIPRLIARARAKKLKIVGPGDNRVDLTYIDNAAQAHLDALDALGRPTDQPNPRGKAYYISNDEPVALWPWINDLLARLHIPPVTQRVPLSIARAAGAAAELAWKTLRLDDEPPMTRFIAMQLATSHWYDMAPAKRDLGYHPAVSMEEGLDRLLKSLATP